MAQRIEIKFALQVAASAMATLSAALLLGALSQLRDLSAGSIRTTEQLKVMEVQLSELTQETKQLRQVGMDRAMELHAISLELRQVVKRLEDLEARVGGRR